MQHLRKIYLSLYQAGTRFLKWRAAQAAKGIEGIPDFVLFGMLFGFSLCASLSGLLLKEVWAPYEQVLHYWAILPTKIRLAVGLMSISLACLFAFVVFLTPIVKALSDEFIRRFKAKPGSV